MNGCTCRAVAEHGSLRAGLWLAIRGEATWPLASPFPVTTADRSPFYRGRIDDLDANQVYSLASRMGRHFTDPGQIASRMRVLGFYQVTIGSDVRIDRCREHAGGRVA